MESEATKFLKGDKIAEGKTKIIWEDVDREDLTVIENKSDITAFDDPNYTKQFKKKAVYATTTTCRVFELLNKAGIPTSFIKQLSPTEFLAEKCDMIPLEVVVRRLAVGSCLERNPEFKKLKGQKPHRFHGLVVEFFLKTTHGQVSIGKKKINLDTPFKIVKKKKIYLEDPLIEDASQNEWNLLHPKKPRWSEESKLNRTISADEIFPKNDSILVIQLMSKIARQTFLLLESAWGNLGYRLIDFKIEFGWTKFGHLVIGDVIDNDSWRLRDREFQEVSKQVFRDGGSLDEVEAKYGHVASMVSQFRLPKQAIVIWKGSPDDKSPEIPDIPGVVKVEIAMSGHKKTHGCLQKLEELQRDYPDGGVIVAPVGMSNGLAPTLSSHTTWPVIATPTTAKEFPEDVWSSLRLPSQNPMATILLDKNAVLFALNILAQKNPAAYMVRQLAIEELDKGY